ncbi:MAG: hypothetical protein ACODAJ_16325, partial [Planctomycetota bacterium]
MVSDGYQYALDVRKNDGQFVRRVAAPIDWEPAIEAARLQALRQGACAAEPAGQGRAAIEPVWDPVLHEPSLAGFRVHLTHDGGLPTTCDFPLDYFRGLAHRISSLLVSEGLLEVGELFRYGAVALRREAGESAASRKRAFGVEACAPPVPCRRRALAARLEHATPQGLTKPGDVPVFIPQSVLDETAEAADLAGTLETGGVLIGHLDQDTATPEVAVVV